MTRVATAPAPQGGEGERMECGVESIYAQFHEPLQRFVRTRVADRAAAEDIVQEVYLRIHLHIDDMRDCSRLPAWIYRIARNAIIDYYRARRTPVELSDLLPAPEDPCAGDASCELAASLDVMIAALPERYRDALSLNVYEALTQEEVARRLGLSVSGAKSRVQRGREKLRDLLLECCHFEFDRYGGILDYQAHCCCCAEDPQWRLSD